MTKCHSGGRMNNLQTPPGTPLSLRGAGQPAKLWRTCHRCVSIASLRCPVISWPPRSPSPPKSTLHKVVGAKLVKHQSDASLLERLLSHRGPERKTRTQPCAQPSSPAVSPASPRPAPGLLLAPSPPVAPFQPPHRSPLLPGLLLTLCILQAAFLKPQPSPAGRFLAALAPSELSAVFICGLLSRTHCKPRDKRSCTGLLAACWCLFPQPGAQGLAVEGAS